VSPREQLATIERAQAALDAARALAERGKDSRYMLELVRYVLGKVRATRRRGVQ